jgi:hypothetical protein
MSAHPHADLMALYAQDAAETETPWDRWEEDFGMGWEPLFQSPTWNANTLFRHKKIQRRWETWVNREANMIGCSSVDMSTSKGWEKITVMEVMP